MRPTSVSEVKWFILGLNWLNMWENFDVNRREIIIFAAIINDIHDLLLLP